MNMEGGGEALIASISKQRSNNKPFDNTNDLVFQALAWHADDYDMSIINGDDEDGMDVNTYMIKVFGSTLDGTTVSVTIKNFTPYFYVKVDDNWTRREIDKFRAAITEFLPYRMRNAIVSVKLFERKDFWGFTNNKLFKFARICFKTIKAMRFLQKKFTTPVVIKDVTFKPVKFQMYESNIDPYIRFMHVKDIEPCGWIRLPPGKYTKSTDILKSISTIDVEVDWQKVEPYKSDQNAPFLVASFDIECTSATGEFPVAVKDYKSLASQLYDVYKNLESSGADDYKKKSLIKRSVQYAFDLVPDCGGHESTVHKLLTKTKPDAAQINKKLDVYIDDMCTILSGKFKTESSSAKPTRDKIVTTLNTTLSGDSMDFPQLIGDSIIQIGTTFHFYGSKECCLKHIITYGTCNPIDGTIVEQCETEEEVLMKWRNLIQAMNPDVLTGYNIFGFDLAYMYDRAKDLGLAREFMKLSRFSSRVCQFQIKQLSSSALGDNILKYIDMEGRVLIDLMKVVQRDHKLDSYKLDNVAYHFMGQNKNDVTPQEIFELQKGDANDRKVIAEYCVQDCALCNYLMMKLEIIANNMGMANVCLVPLSFIFMRGQGIKIFSLVLKQCKEDEFLIPVIKPPYKPPPGKGQAVVVEEEPSTSEEDGYEGAIVLEPKDGIYIDDPVSVLDYASLYPSSMISENLSHDMIVLDPKYDNLPGVEYLDITYDIYEGTGDKKVKSGERVCRFVQPPNNEKGVIPNILMKLLKARKTTRKKMEMQQVKLKTGEIYRGFVNEDKNMVTQEDGTKVTIDPDTIEDISDCYNEFQKAVLDGLQLAYKVTANSLYGQIGAKTSPIYLKDIAACTTATGRKMIMMAKDFLEKNYNANIVYGDSVTGYTPILLRVNGEVFYETIENIATVFNGNWVHCIENGKQDKEGCDLSHLDIDTWTEQGWTKLNRVIRHKLAPHKKIIRVLTHTGVVDVTDDHSLLDPAGNHVTSKELKVGDKLLHHDLPEGYSSNEFAYVKGMSDTVTIHCESQITAANAYVIISSYGYDITIEMDDKDNYYIKCSKPGLNKNKEYANDDATKIMRMQEIPYEGYVYDLTTDNHHFAAGVGKLIVHNTDSIFCVFPNTTLEAEVEISHEQAQILKGRNKIMPSIQTAIKASGEFKKLIKQPHDLEYEKTFWPFILLSKKRYVGNLYETNDKKFKQKSMGIVLKRRDNANIVKKVYGGIIDIILNKQNVNESVEFLTQNLNDLVAGRCPLEDLIITKSLRADSSYKDPTRIAHKVLAERMGERDPGNKPQANDRIPYIYVQTPPPTDKNEKVLQGERIEHPDFIRKNDLKPDYNFYITNQIMKPILQVYGIVVEQLPGYNKPANFFEVVEKSVREEFKDDEKKIKDKITTIRENTVKEVLFDPVLAKIENVKIKRSLASKKYYKPIEPMPEILLPKPKAPRKKATTTTTTNDTTDAAAKPPPKPRAPRTTKKKVTDVAPPAPTADETK